MPSAIGHYAFRMQKAKGRHREISPFGFSADRGIGRDFDAYWPKYVLSARGCAPIVRPDCDEPFATEP